MNCISCGATIDLNSTQKYVKCTYCGVSNANFTPFEIVDLHFDRTNIEPNDYEKLALLFKLKEYTKLKFLAESIIEKNPISWVGLVYLALADFWTGLDDFEHLASVSVSLDKARILSDNNEFVVDACSKISNDIIVCACKNEIYGDDLINALNAFQCALKICSIDESTKKNMLDYCERVFVYIEGKLQDLLSKNKKDYDPPLTMLNNLFALMEITKNLKYAEFCYLHCPFHIAKNSSKSYFNSMKEKFQSIEIVLKSNNSLIVGKSIKFNLFGKMIIE